MNSPRFAAGPTPRRAAFTLVELLVTMVVALLLIVFLFQLFNATMRAWQRGETQNETYREARAAMQMIVRDLSQTTAPMAGSIYASPTPTPGASPGVVAPVLVLDRFAPPQSGDEINEEAYCLTTIPNNGASSLCAVGYFCAWKPDLYPDGNQKDRAPRAYSLMRQYLGSGAPAVGSTAAVPGLYDRFQKYSGTSPLTFVQVFDRAVPPNSPANDPPQATATEVASYIWDLQIRTRDTLQSTAANIYKTQPPYPSVLPPYLEVRFKALSEDAARQLPRNDSVKRTDWNDSDPTNPTSVYRRIIQPGTRQFSARVPIYSGSATSTSSP